MKKYLQTIAYVVLLTQVLNAQVTSPGFDPAWAARFQNAINTGLPAAGKWKCCPRMINWVQTRHFK